MYIFGSFYLKKYIAPSPKVLIFLSLLSLHGANMEMMVKETSWNQLYNFLDKLNLDTLLGHCFLNIVTVFCVNTILWFFCVCTVLITTVSILQIRLLPTFVDVFHDDPLFEYTGLIMTPPSFFAHPTPSINNEWSLMRLKGGLIYKQDYLLL